MDALPVSWSAKADHPRRAGDSRTSHTGHAGMAIDSPALGPLCPVPYAAPAT